MAQRPYRGHQSGVTAAKVKIKVKEEIAQILHRLNLLRKVEHIL
jgi:hypothetical protein